MRRGDFLTLKEENVQRWRPIHRGRQTSKYQAESDLTESIRNPFQGGKVPTQPTPPGKREVAVSSWTKGGKFVSQKKGHYCGHQSGPLLEGTLGKC